MISAALRRESYARRAMLFSRRTSWAAGENEWAEARRAHRGPLVDLTISNPTLCGLTPDFEHLLSPLGYPGALRYTPDPLGMPDARMAVAAYYRDHGAEVPIQHLCLTTSTSEGYSFLFRLLCDPGDEVLIARPSYPLLELLAQLDDIALREYPLHYDPGAVFSAAGGWSVDTEALQASITERTRAVVVVHPNNPTGNFVPSAERLALETICAARGLALIVDEVFLDYPVHDQLHDSVNSKSFAAGSSPCLCFVLSGLSKICALPQMKLSWIAVSGPDELVTGAMERLEIVADTFLSLNAPVQFALPHWLADRHETQRRIRDRIAENLHVLDGQLAGTTASRLSVEGGWTVVLRVPQTVDGEEFSLAAMERGVLVQPGEFYGLPPGRCVLSLLTAPERWAEGLGLLPIR